VPKGKKVEKHWPRPFSVAYPQALKRKVAFYDIFIENLSVNPKLMKIERNPCDFSRTPGWEPLVWTIFV